MKRILSILTILLALLVLVSCTNDISDPAKSGEPSTWKDVFLTFWNTMNTEYVHFESEPDLDWDGVYSEYLQRFEKLNFKLQSDSMKAFSCFKEIALKIKCDNHYELTISDGFGSYLAITPAAERKWEAAGENRKIESYPDIVWIENDVKSLRAVNGDIIIADTSKPTNVEEENYKSFLKGIEGYYEIENLNKNGYFHNETKDLPSDFGNGYVSAVISTSEKVDAYYETGSKVTSTSGISTPSYDRKAAGMSSIKSTEAQTLWKDLVTELKLEGFSYFYGLTDDGIFYFYLSSFPSEKILELEAILSPVIKGETYLSLSDEMKALFDRLWKGGENRLYDDMETQISQLKGICDLVNNLRLIGSINECIVDGLHIHNVDGVIMDVRCNGGGDFSFLLSLMGSFFSDETQVGYLRYRDGYSRYEYTPWVTYEIPSEYSNAPADECYQKPFYIIVNGASGSCSEIAALMVKLLPQGKVLGTTTYGATCGLSDRNTFHSGPFSSGNVSIYTASFEIVGKNKESYEGSGITPDVKVESDGTGADTRYLRALEEIKKTIAASSSGS